MNLEETDKLLLKFAKELKNIPDKSDKKKKEKQIV